MDDKINKQQKYILMMKKIIKGNAKMEDFQQEEKSSESFSNSIIANFLSNLLSKTSDKYINSQIREFRKEMIRRNQKKRFPHVFERLMKSSKSRDNESSLSPNISTTKNA